MHEVARDRLLAEWNQHGQELAGLSDLFYCPPGARFTARYGLPPRVGCQGTTRDGRPCAAHATIIGPIGYCHWHDPGLETERVAWAEGRKGSRLLRWFARIAPEACQAIAVWVAVHPDLAPTALPPLDLAGIPDGQRRVIVALLAEPEGRTYPATAATLGIHLGTVHRHLARLRERRPAVYAAVLAQRETQLATRHEGAEDRARGRRAGRRAADPARYGRAPWAGHWHGLCWARDAGARVPAGTDDGRGVI